MDMTATFANGTRVEYKSVQKRQGVRCIVKNDYDQLWGDEWLPHVYHVSRCTRNQTAYGAVSGTAVAATATFLNDKNVIFNCDLQYWVHEMCCRRAGMLSDSLAAKQAFNNAFRDDAFMTNYAGTRTREDCVNKTNIGKGYPVIQQMSTGGTLHRISGEIRKFGEDAWLIDAINPLVEYRSFDYTTHPHLFFFPTQSKRWWLFDIKGNIIEKREHYQEPLFMYQDKSVMPIFGFIFNVNSSTGWSAAIPKWRVRVLRDDEPVPNPYIMADGRVITNPYSGV